MKHEPNELQRAWHDKFLEAIFPEKQSNSWNELSWANPCWSGITKATTRGK